MRDMSDIRFSVCIKFHDASWGVFKKYFGVFYMTAALVRIEEMVLVNSHEDLWLMH